MHQVVARGRSARRAAAGLGVDCSVCVRLHLERGAPSQEQLPRESHVLKLGERWHVLDSGALPAVVQEHLVELDAAAELAVSLGDLRAVGAQKASESYR